MKPQSAPLDYILWREVVMLRYPDNLVTVSLQHNMELDVPNPRYFP